ncbi:MAG: xanthine dehydrogenase family protein molybdopterin-binding subunit, partial [Bradyrhizobiaceae bacterium]|nr:xanthine dehydrogenase family protein molybdopterin-binding subunit [Bradyrhizobiaceae bacterium]
MGSKLFGARVARLEDPSLLTGRGRYVDDVKVAGMLHACFARSPLAHARIKAIDVSAAAVLPGVHAVLTAADLPQAMRSARIPMLVPNPSIAASLTQHCLAQDEVCYVGQPLAVVIADSRYIAEDAALLIDVDYEVLPAVSDCRDAAKASGPPAHMTL